MFCRGCLSDYPGMTSQWPIRAVTISRTISSATWSRPICRNLLDQTELLETSVAPTPDLAWSASEDVATASEVATGRAGGRARQYLGLRT